MANLITAQEVIELAFSENSNMREESIPKTAIGVAEIKYIRPAFGAMYALLADKYADFTNEYVKPALAYFVKCEMMSSIAIDMSNSGVAVSSPQYQSAATDKQRQRLYDSEMGKAKTLLDYALSYIAVHSEEFPDYSGSIGKKSYRVGGILLGNERVATSIMGEAFKEEYERYLREMQEINEVVVDATEDVSKALIATNEAIANTEEAVEKANTATANANTAAEKTEEATQKANNTISNAEDAINRANTAAENAEKVGEDIQRIEVKAEANSQEIQNIKKNAVKPDDYYPKMSVGFADNLVGRGEATAEEFTYRASAGMGRSITDDTARVKKIKGNSVVWNQLFTPIVNTFTKQGLTFIIDETGKVRITGTSTSQAGIAIGIANIVSGRKYLYIGIPKDINRRWWWSDQASGQDYGLGVITTPTYPDENRYFVINVTEGTTVDITFYPKVYDLTQMFGAGNEPTTVEEFYTRIPSGIDITAYNEGEIISVNTETIKTVGFNQWDEQWELGDIKADGTNGGYVANYIRSKNYIPVIGGMYYYMNRPASTSDCQIFCYDKSKNIISHYTGARDYATQIPLNATYVRFYLNYGSEVYHNDICYNLSHTGVNNGKYKPYTPFTRELPIIKKYFQNGMRSAGTAFDSIEWDSSKQKWVAVQRIGVVDMGDLYWGMLDATTGRNTLFYADIHGRKPSEYEILCAKYITKSYIGLETDKAVLGNSGANNIYIVDTDYTDATEFKSAMQGVMLNYELAEPIVTEIEEEYLNFDYDVEDFGTEEALSSVPSAPFSADIIYKFNAVDSIRQNRLDIKALQELVLSLQSQISAMQTAQVKEQE